MTIEYKDIEQKLVETNEEWALIKDKKMPSEIDELIDRTHDRARIIGRMELLNEFMTILLERQTK